MAEWIEDNRTGVVYPDGGDAPGDGLWPALKQSGEAIAATMVRYEQGSLAERPVATADNAGTLWWTGSRFSWSDEFHDQGNGTTAPGWVDIAESNYVSVADYGALPLTDVSYVPLGPAGVWPVGYDPLAYWRARDCTAKFIEAGNDAIRSGRILFIPPGTYPLFGPVVLSGDAAPVPVSSPGSGRGPAPAAGRPQKRHLRVLGSWPNTILWVFPENTISYVDGPTTVWPGFNSAKKVIDVTDAYGVMTGAHIEGIRYVGGKNGIGTGGRTTVFECVGYETNATTSTHKIWVEESVSVTGAAVDLSAGISITNTQPHSVQEIYVYGPPVAKVDRPATATPGPNYVAVNLSFPNIRCRNIHVEGYQLGVKINYGNGVDTVSIDGLSCQGMQVADIEQLGSSGVAAAGNLFMRGYSSTGSARAYNGGICNATMSGVFRATDTGCPADVGTAADDWARISGYGQFSFENFAVSSNGPLRSIGVNPLGSGTTIDISFLRSLIPASVLGASPTILRTIAGSLANVILGAWWHSYLHISTGAVLGRQIRMPTSADTAQVTNSAGAPAGTIADATAATDANRLLAKIAQYLGIAT